MRALDQTKDLAAAFEAWSNPCMLPTPDLRCAGMSAACLAAVGMTQDRLTGRQIFEAFTGRQTGAGPGSSVTIWRARSDLATQTVVL